MILARLFPEAGIVGVDMSEPFLSVAQARADLLWISPRIVSL